MREVSRIQNRKLISFALGQGPGPILKEASRNLRNLPAGSKVCVYSTKKNKWCGPYKFINVEGEAVTIQTARRRKIFRSTCVKPISESKIEDMSNLSDAESATLSYAVEPKHETKTQQRRTEKELKSARPPELQGVIENGTFVRHPMS